MEIQENVISVEYEVEQQSILVAWLNEYFVCNLDQHGSLTNTKQLTHCCSVHPAMI